ncbi:translation elongation factor Ts [Candidatus Sumerlaeota bacterium]|nr:translation elongation factor Ts [Candidatus Sumerlaeota bacterium]
MAIGIEQVKELRAKTGAGIGDCKKALEQANGDMEASIKWLRERGQQIADKKSSRSSDEGLIHAYIHPPGKIGVMVQISSESDFVAKHEDFKQLCHDVAMHIAAAAPQYVSSEDVDPAKLVSEKEIFRTQALSEGKPEKIVEKIIEGRVKKFYQEVCLLEQAFVKDPDKTIQQLVTECVAKFGENITIKRFARWSVGE